MTSDHHCNVGRNIGRPAWPLVGLVAAVLTGTVVLELEGRDDPVPIAERSIVSPVAPHALEVAAAHGNSQQSVERMLARPLFRQNRRPPADTPVLIAGSPKLPRLTGVVVSPAGGFAIFAGTEGGKPIIVQEGDRVGDVVIEAVAAGLVTLRGPGGLAVLHPSFGERALQVSRLSSASPTRPEYRPRQGGHDAAILNRKRVPAT